MRYKLLGNVSYADAIAELRGWTPFIGIQIMYSLIERSAERESLPWPVPWILE